MHQTNPRPMWSHVGFFAVAYLLGAEVGHGFSMPSASGLFATFWPPSGLYLAGLLLCSPRSQPRIVLAALLGNLLSDVVLHGQTFPVSLGFWAAHTLEAVVAATALRWWTNGSVKMSRLADVIKLIVVGVVASAVPGAAVGATILHATGGGDVQQNWLAWWMADALGILAFAPLVLSWTRADDRPMRQLAGVRKVEFLLLLTLQVVFVAFVLNSPLDTRIPKRCVMLPIMIWAALRFGPRGITISLALLVCQSIGSTVRGFGSIAGPEIHLERQIVELQFLLSVLVISMLIVSAFNAERAVANRDLKRREALLQAIHRAQTEFIDDMPAPDVFRKLLEDLMRLTDSDCGFISEVRPAGEAAPQLPMRTIAGLVRDPGHDTFTERNDSAGDLETLNLTPLVREVLTTGRPVHSRIPVNESYDGRQMTAAPECHALLGLPLYYGDRLVGLVGILNQAEDFPPDLPDFLAPVLGTCGHLLEMHRQKSARRHVEEELRKSRARLEAAQSRAKLGCWEYDERTRVSFWSPEVYRLLYRAPTPEQPGFEETLELIHPDDRAELLRIMGEVVKNGGSLNCEYRTNPTNGPMRYLSTTIERVELREDGTTVLAGIVQDVTERREAGMAIERSERELTDFFEHANMGLQWLGLDGRVLRANPAVLEMLGYQADEYVGQHIASFYVDPHEAHDLLDRIEAGEELENFEARLRCKDGTGRDVLISSNVYRDGGCIRHARCFLRDVSELRRLEQQFYQAQKMDAIGRLAGGVAHDFNNLLTVINGYARLLNDGLPAGDSRRALVNEISNAGERAASLTRQLLTFSRQQIVRPKIFDLNEVVRGMQGLLGRLIGEDICLSSELDAAPLFVRADKGQLDQVLLNLVVNARDAMPQGGRLQLKTMRGVLPEEVGARVSARDVGPYAVLEVRDTGCGMDKATLTRIFEPFFTTKPPGQGTGLGLATVYGIVKQSGGHVSVFSQPSDGATFRVYLPCLDTTSDDEPIVGDSSAMPEAFLGAAQGI